MIIIVKKKTQNENECAASSAGYNYSGQRSRA